MLGTTYDDLRQGNALVRALMQREITSREFEDAAEFLESEAAQVIATVLGLARDDCSTAASRARIVCLHVARHTRNLN